VRFCLTTLLARDPVAKRGLPAIWAIHSKEDEHTMRLILDAVAKRMGPGFTPRVLLIDDAPAEIAAAESCMWAERGMVYMLCIWHVLRCWVRHLRMKVRGAADRTALLSELQKIMYGTRQRVRLHEYGVGAAALLLPSARFHRAEWE
jgi:hypothetical protein